MKKFRLILSFVLALSLMVTSSAFVFASYDDTARARPQLCDPYTDPEAVIVEGGRTSTGAIGSFPKESLTRGIDTLSVVKGSAIFHETGVGAHYYAFGSYGTTYKEAFANVVLPTSLNNGQRNAFISLGICGENGGVDLGITNEGSGWMPYYYDVCGHTYVTYPSYPAPSSATNAILVATIVNTTTVQFYVRYLDANNNQVGNSLWKQIPVASGNFTTENGNVKCRFYRFASLVPKLGFSDNQMDSTYMLNGVFTGCQLLYTSSNTYTSWGINNSNMTNVWKVSPERISLSYSGTTDTFSIDHWST